MIKIEQYLTGFEKYFEIAGCRFLLVSFGGSVYSRPNSDRRAIPYRTQGVLLSLKQRHGPNTSSWGLSPRDRHLIGSPLAHTPGKVDR